MFNPAVAGLAAVTVLFFLLPLSGLVFRAPWGSMTNVITSSTSLDALRLSLIASLATTVLALLFAGIGLVAVLTTLLAVTGGPTGGLPVLGPVVGAVAALRVVVGHLLREIFDLVLDLLFGDQHGGDVVAVHPDPSQRSHADTRSLPWARPTAKLPGNQVSP